MTYHELLSLLIEGGCWEALKALLLENASKIFSVRGDVLLSIVRRLQPEDVSPLALWPNERLGDAPRTAVLNVAGTVALRQRALIESLLTAINGL
jgi:hypothetical protein